VNKLRKFIFFLIILLIINETWAETNNYIKALEFLRKEDYFHALPLFEAALKKSPENIFIKADYVLCLIWMGNYKKAIEFYLQNEDSLKDVKYLTRNIAKAFYEVKNYHEAKKLYEKALLNNPKDIEAIKGLIFTLCKLGDYEKAYRIIEEKRNFLNKKILYFLKAYTLQQKEFYNDAYILYSKLTLLEGEEKFLKEIQDARRDIIKNFKKEEITYLFKKFQQKPLKYILLLIDTKRYLDAIKAFESFSFDVRKLPFGFLLELGWAYFKVKRNKKAIEIYNFILQKRPDSYLAKINIAYSLAIDSKFKEAHELLDKVLKKKQFLIDALFAKAFVYEKQRDFLKAIKIYDQILKLKPKNIIALKLKIKAISDLGATSYAYYLTKLNKLDPDFLEVIKGDLAINKLKWDEPDEAIKILKQQIKDNPKNFRARCDYIVALRKKVEMKKVIEEFEILKKFQKPIPFWVNKAVADAYLYLKEPKKALKFYKKTFAKQPENFDALLGLFYTYQILRDWENDEKIWSIIKKQMSQSHVDVWKKLEALEARGWYLMYQDKLKEAQTYFLSLLKKAGLNPGIRTGLGHVYFWRGWPRLALEELNIAKNLEKKDIAPLIGITKVLNELNYKKEARKLAQELFKKHPKNRHVLDLLEDLKVEDMRKLWAEFSFVNENPGAHEYWFKTRLTESISPLFRLHQEVIWLKASWYGNSYSWNRIGLGAEWIVKPEIIWEQEISFDYQKGKDFGYQTTITWLPTDPLKIALSFNSFSLTLPVEAMGVGIEGKTAKLNVLYHESDLRYYGLSIIIHWFSKNSTNADNTSYNYRLFFNQNILNTPDFKIRLELAWNHSFNKETFPYVKYFSPLNAFTFSVTPSLHWTHYKRYSKSFVSSIYPVIGIYREHKFGCYGVGGITYEQIFDFSKTFSFMWNISWHHKVYYGDDVDVWSCYLGLKKNF